MVRAGRPRPPPPSPHSWVQAAATLATTIAVLGCCAAVLLPCIAAAPASTVAGTAAAAPPPSPGAAVPGGTVNVLRLPRQMHRPGAEPSPPTAADSSEASVTATRRTADKIYSRHLDRAIAIGSSSSSRITISPGVAAPPFEIDAGSSGGGRKTATRDPRIPGWGVSRGRRQQACADKPATTFTDIATGRALSCQDLAQAGLCNHPDHAEEIQTVCPASCQRCGTEPGESGALLAHMY